MKQTITQRFNKFKQHEIGSVITLATSIRGMKYGKQIINDGFKKFVLKSEYDPEEKDELLNWLYKHSEVGEVAEIPLKNKGIENDN